MAEIVTAQEVKDYIGIDYTDTQTDNNINRICKTTDAYLKGSLGDEYDVTDPKAKELALIVASDLYDNRGMNEKVSPTVRKLVSDFMFQLRLETDSKNGI